MIFFFLGNTISRRTGAAGLRGTAWGLVLILALFYTGCQAPRSHVSTQEDSNLRVGKTVVVGFRPLADTGDGAAVIRSPLTGTTFMGSPVPEAAIRAMTDSLVEKLVDAKRGEIISPGQAKGVYSSLVSSDEVLGEGALFQGVGKAFASDAVLVGYIYRWLDREGTDYAVSRPASVAFELCFIRPSDGAILWKGRFDKTQHSLSENLLDMDTFVKGKGKWMTAGSLAELGLAALVAEMPMPGKEKGE